MDSLLFEFFLTSNFITNNQLKLENWFAFNNFFILQLQELLIKGWSNLRLDNC